MKIAIVELYGHRSDVEYLVAVLAERHELQVWAPSFILDRLPKRLQSGTLSLKTMASSNFSIPDSIAKADLIIAVTLMANPAPWKKILELPCPKIALIHNAYWSLNQELIPASGWTQLWTRTKLRLRGLTSRRLQLSRSFEAWVFPSADIAEEQRDHLDRPSLGITWALSGKARQASLVNPNLLVVPGGVDFEFRDFDRLFAGLALLSEEQEWELEFLGCSTRKSDVRKLRALIQKLPPHVKAFWQDGYTATEQYEDRLAQALAIILPHKGTVPFAGYQEKAGFSKVSGAENDAVRAARPLIVDERYRGCSNLKSVQWSYDSPEAFAALIHNLQKQPERALLFPEEVQLSWQAARWDAFVEGVMGLHLAKD